MSRRVEHVAGAKDADVLIRECTTVEEFDACIRLQREVFGLPDLEVSPRRHLIVSRLAGGWVRGRAPCRLRASPRRRESA